MAEEKEPPPFFKAVFLDNLELVRQLIQRDKGVVNSDWSGFSPIHLAVEANRPRILEELLDHGASLEVRTPTGNGGLTPLLQAAHKGVDAITEVLLHHGARIEETDSVDGNTALSLAATEGNSSTVALLLSKRANVEARNKRQRTPLLCAAFNGHSLTVSHLLGHGANIKETDSGGNTAIHLAVWGGHEDTVALLASRGAPLDAPASQGATPLLIAVQNGMTDMCALLLSLGCDVEESHQIEQTVPLQYAAIKGCHSMVRLLLSRGAEVNTRRGGSTPIFLASQEGNLASAVTLLQQGADQFQEQSVGGALPIHAAAQKNHAALVEVLIDHGCSIDQPDLVEGKTPLMTAARAAADETVSTLLSLGASPDNTDHGGTTALSMAIESKCISTIDLLAPVTNARLGRSLVKLACEKVKISPEVEKMLERAAQDYQSALLGLQGAAAFGSSQILSKLLNHIDVSSIPEWSKVDLMIKAVESDCKDTAKVLLPLLNSIPEEILSLVRKRAVPEMVCLFMSEDEAEVAVEKAVLKDAVINQTAKLLDQIPRDVEFTYNNKFTKLKPLINNPTVPYEHLLEQLHLPKLHIGDRKTRKLQEKEAECPASCRQRLNCKRMREALDLVHIIAFKLGEVEEVFKELNVSLIGSTSEGSRAFFYDEMDVHLSLNKKFKAFSIFDDEEQVLFRDPTKADVPDFLDQFFDEDNVLKAKHLFFHFVISVYAVMSTLVLPTEFTMLPLKMSHVPCLKCMARGPSGLQVKRCQHKTDCKQHKDCTCSDQSICECSEQCRCREYGSPSLTWSKVGVVLHLQWRNEDGTLWTIDCDLNCPTWPCATPYDGSISKAALHISQTRPVGWLEEYSKLEGMECAQLSPHLQKNQNWQIRFRLINRTTVNAGQGLLFMSDQTLMGKKLKVYAMLKILKYCTDSPARSYQLKFALNMVLGNKTDEDIGALGKAIMDVIYYLTIRGKFSSVHPDLATEGILGVEVGAEGLIFLRHPQPGLQSREPRQRAVEEVTRLENAGEAARQRKDFDLAIRCYEAAVNWQPCRKGLWQHLATAMLDAGASKECSWLSKKADEVCERKPSLLGSQDQNEVEMLQQAIALSLEQEELAETKNQSEDLEADKEEVEPKSLAKKEGDAEELESDEEMLQLAIAMSLAQEKEMQ